MSVSGLRTQLNQTWQTRRGHLKRRVVSGPLAAAPNARPATPGPHRQLRQQLFEHLLLDVEEGGAKGLQDAPVVRDRVRRVVERALERGDVPALSRLEREELENELVAEATGIGPLSSLVADPTVSDILVNGPSDVFVDRFGRLEKTTVRFDSAS